MACSFSIGSRSVLATIAALSVACWGCSGGNGNGGGDSSQDSAADSGRQETVEPEQSHPVDVPDLADAAPEVRADVVQVLDLQDTQGDQADSAEAPDVPQDATEVKPDDWVTVECGELPPVEGGACSVVPGSDTVLLQGTVLAPKEVFAGGGVLFANGRILCVGCDCADRPEAVGATVLSCPKSVVSPGLINAHDHITYTQNSPSDWGDERFDHRHDWRLGIRGHKKIKVSGGAKVMQITWGEMRQVLAGTTSLAGSGSAPGFLRNLDKTANEGLEQPAVYYNTFPLGDNDGTLLVGSCAYPAIDGKWVLENDCYLPHVSEGVDKEARNEFVCLSKDANGGVDLTEPGSAFVHCIGLRAQDGAELAANGTAVVWSPRSNVALYGNTAQVTLYHRQGVLVALGTDWTASGSVNILRELQCASFLNEYYLNQFFSDKDFWEMATTNAASALAVDDATGLLREGLFADIALFDASLAENPYRAVIDASPTTTLLVLRGGLPLYGETVLVQALPQGKDGCEAIPGGVCGQIRSICAVRETGYTLADLSGANESAYGLFFCGDPPGEPTCVPMRPGEFDGESQPSDLDGDGVVNDEDNCVYLFNPPRPVDDGKQADQDGDGLGDPCDPCPLDAQTNTCKAPDPLDKDGDGFLNYEDNCSKDPNPGQEDEDLDGTGDACDFCPQTPNPGNSPCECTIYDLKTGLIKLGAPVAVEGVVTAVAAPRFFVQVPSDQLDEALGYQFGGIYVYLPSNNPDMLVIPETGDRVRVTGVTQDWWGQMQLTYVEAVDVLDTGVPLPEPIVVTPQEVCTNGELSAAYEAVLVRVVGAEVTALQLAAGPGDKEPTNEFQLAGLLPVDDFFHLVAPFPELGDVISVTGVLRFANNAMKLNPRGPEDIIPALALAEFESPLVFVDEGTADVQAIPPLVVRLTAPAPAEGIAVALQSSAPEQLLAPASILVPGGQTEAAVPLSGLVGGIEPVIVTATLEDKSVEAQVVVIAADRIPLPTALSPAEVQVAVDSIQELTVSLDIPARPGGTLVLIDADTEGVLALPESVLVEEGAFTAQFAVTAVAAGKALVTAATEAGETSALVEVVDLPLVGMILTEVLYDVPGTDDGYEWVEIYNGTMKTVELAGYSLGSGGTSYTASVLQLEGALAPGQCFVVGGPLSDAANYSPVFGQAADFEPDIQNSGSTADGVALFAIPAAGITPSTVPIDAVIFGGTNSSGLLDETGAAGAVDAPDASSGNSIHRTVDGWSVQPAPTPGDCSHAFLL